MLMPPPFRSMFGQLNTPTSVFLQSKYAKTSQKATNYSKFFQFRRFALRVPEPPCDLTLPQYRHELPFQPGVVNELPPQDWRNQPVRIDFERLKKPSNSYERFIAAHVHGPDSPYLKLTKGQFIVHMRRLAMEQRAFRGPAMLFTSAVLVAGLTAYSLEEFYPDTDRTTRDDTQLAYDKLTWVNPLLKDIPRTDAYRSSTDTFFSLPPERVAKLPQDLQNLYNKNKDSYFATHDFKKQQEEDAQYKHYLESADRLDALMKKHNLSARDIVAIIASCNQEELYKEVNGVKDISTLPRGLRDSFYIADHIVKKYQRGEQITEEDLEPILRPAARDLIRAAYKVTPTTSSASQPTTSAESI